MKPLKKINDIKEKRAKNRRIKDGVGTIAGDGSIYLGRYKGQYWYATATDAQDIKGNRLGLAFNAASAYAEALDAHGHQDWGLPDKDILQKMAESRDTGAFKGTYDSAGYYPQADYWSSTVDDGGASKKNKKLNLGVVKFATTHEGTTETKTRTILGMFTLEMTFKNSTAALRQNIHFPKSQIYYCNEGNSPAFSVRCVRTSPYKL